MLSLVFLMLVLCGIKRAVLPSHRLVYIDGKGGAILSFRVPHDHASQFHGPLFFEFFLNFL